MIDVSFFLPGIRTHFWEKFYETAKASCQDYTFEIVVCSPFDPPESLKNVENFRVIKDWGNPTRCAQIAALHSKGTLLYHVVDDGYFFPRSVDLAVKFYQQNCTEKDMVNMRYREGPNYSGNVLPLEFWNARGNVELQQPGVNQDWRISLHFLISRAQFYQLGGFDTKFEYLNHPLHDFAFRAQAAGGKIYHSPLETINCTHYPDRTVDHGPIHDAQLTHDAPIFHEMYQNPKAAFDRIDFPFDDWKNSPEIWDRRFKGKKAESYSEIV